LESCPFLAIRDGIYVADLSYIPEKYSLDVARASKILNDGLKRWLTTIEDFVSGNVVRNGSPGSCPLNGK